jgi:hypothetical protein
MTMQKEGQIVDGEWGVGVYIHEEARRWFELERTS